MKTHATKKIAALLAGIAVASAAYAEGSPKAANASTLAREDGTSIRYYLEFANGRGASDRLLLALQGSDANSVARIAAIGRVRNVCPDADLLTVEKFGITSDLPYSTATERGDCPKDYLTRDNPSRRVADAMLVIESLRAKYGYKKVAVIGGSEGSIVAALLASRAPYVDAAILFGGGGRWFRDDVLQTLKSSPMSADDLKKNIDGFNQFADYVVASKEPFALAMSDHGYSWWKEMLSIDHQKTIGSISAPVLVAQGGLDTSASPEAAKEMVFALAAGGKKNLAFLFYPDKNHSLGFSDGDGSSDKPLADMKAWLDKALSD